MASLSGSSRERLRRVLVPAAALAAFALIALLLVWSRREGDGTAPTPGVAEGSRAVSPVGIPRDVSAPEALEGVRAEPEPSASAEDAGSARLVGRVLDERGLPLSDEVPRVVVESAAGERLAASVDVAGGFGPLRLAPGTWTVSAAAAGRRGATRTLAIARGETPATVVLTLPRVIELAVTLRAVGAGSDGDPARDLEELRGLLSLALAADGDAHVERRRVEAGRTLFQPVSGSALALELHLGGESVLRQTLAADAREVTLAVDPLDLAARLVQLEVELRDRAGAPLTGVTQVLLAWESGTHLVAGQPGLDPARARFEVCPPGPARLSVVDVDGRRASAELSVPHAGPALLQVELELREPERR
jgi:hypothetical protein